MWCDKEDYLEIDPNSAVIKALIYTVIIGLVMMLLMICIVHGQQSKPDTLDNIMIQPASTYVPNCTC